MNCVLHIGTEKTGTTILQRWLYSNKENLSKQKIFLSDVCGKPNNRIFAACFQNFIDNFLKGLGIVNLNDKNEFSSVFLARLADEIKSASDTHSLYLITSEHLHSRILRRTEITKIKIFLSGLFDNVFVICYFRNQSDLAVSRYSTALKFQYADTLETFVSDIKINSYYYDYNQIADNWSSVFGRDNCIFRIYDQNHFYQNDLRKDFLNALPLETDEETLNYSIQTVNKSLSKFEAEAYTLINKYIPYENCLSEKGKLNHTFKSQISKIQRLKHGYIDSLSYKDKIYDMFKESNILFFNKYFNGTQYFAPPFKDIIKIDKFRNLEIKIIIHLLKAILLVIHKYNLLSFVK